MKKTNSNETLTEATEDLFENAPCGYISFSADGKIQRVNKTLLSLLKYEDKETLEARRFQGLFKIGGKIYFETHFFPLIQIQGFIREINFDLIKKDGTTFPALINVDEVKPRNDAPVTYRATILDITDRKKYETALLEAKEKAEAASRAKAEFLSTISHEIRTPLNAILGIGNLIHETPLNQLQQEYARILKFSADNLLNLVNNLLDLSKLEAQKVKLEKRIFNIKDLVKVLAQTYKIKASEKEIQLKLSLPVDLPEHLIGDPVKLSQILTNLLGNAIKFTKKGYVELKINILKSEGNNVLLQFKVIDTGIGIPEDKLEIIFQEFSQASYDVNLEFGGTGLGLTISQKLLQMHESELKVESQVGKGTTFGFDLQFNISTEEKIKRKPKPKVLEILSHLNKKVLVVDDNEVNTFIAKQYLELWKMQSTAVDSGIKAIEEITKNHYDVILMDLHMPKMSGYETATKIRQLKLEKQPVIIALSASGRGDLNLKLERAGIDDYVPKPFDPLELQETLVNHLTKGEKGRRKNFSLQNVEKQNNDLLHGEIIQPSFEITRYKKLAGSNEEVLNQLIKNSLKAIQKYRQEFTEVVETDDANRLQELIHINTTSVHYLQAKKLSSLIAEFYVLLNSSEEKSLLAEKAEAIICEFNTIISGLGDLVG